MNEQSVQAQPVGQDFNRLAIVLQTASTGGWRYIRSLIGGLREVAPHLQITCYLGTQVETVFESEQPRRTLEKLQVEVRNWLEPSPPPDLSGHRFMLKRWLKRRRFHRQHEKELALHQQVVNELNRHAVVFFAWPYFMNPPELSVPVAFIPHDFNYAHFVGLFITSRTTYETLRDQHRHWLRRAQPVVSTPFVARELAKVFPEYDRPARVIYLSRLGGHPPMAPSRAQSIVAELGVQGDYVLNLNNITPHKNLGQVMAGFYHCLETWPNLKLVIAGYATEGIRGRANGPNYIDNCEEDWNVASLGLVTDEQVTALIQCAKLVINASLYEAGNGSGLDAWAIGTPVAMSNIAPFIEQMAYLRVEAQTFEPRCCFQVRDAMLEILDHPAEAQAAAQRSQAALAQYSWLDVGRQYLDFFQEIRRGQ